jgi:DNA-binding beta-propeller fold protein YncE
VLASPTLGPDGSLVVGPPEDDRPGRVVDLATGATAREVPAGELAGWLWADGMGQLLRFDAAADEVVVSELLTGTEVRRFSAKLPDAPWAVVVSADGERAFVSDERSGDVTVVDLEAGRVRRVLRTELPLATLVVDDRGSRLFVAGETTTIFDVDRGAKVGELPAANVALSPDGSLIAGNEFNGRITFYDAATRRPTGDALAGGTAFSNTMFFTPDGRLLLTAGLDGTLRFWDVAGRRQVGPSVPIADPAMALTQDGRRLVLETDAGVQQLALDRSTLRDVACRTAARNLTADEWRQHIGGEPVRLCPSHPVGR